MDEILYHINRVKSGDDASFEQLLSKYNALIISMAKKYSDMCATSPQLDDFLQEAKMAFYNSVLSYDEKTGVTFGAYAKVCVRNRLVSCVRVNNSKKRQKRSDTKDSYDLENPQDALIVREL
jgi:RNA polymerase sporulation-specific sigma factor